MTRKEAVDRLTPIIRRALIHAEDEFLDSCSRLSRGVLRVAYNLVVNRSELVTRIAVEVTTETLAPSLNPMLADAVELFRPGQSLHSAVSAAMSESSHHELS